MAVVGEVERATSIQSGRRRCSNMDRVGSRTCASLQGNTLSEGEGAKEDKISLTRRAGAGNTDVALTTVAYKGGNNG